MLGYKYKCKLLITFMFPACLFPVLTYGNESFNPQFLENIDNNVGAADLDLLTRGDVAQLPGVYNVDIHVNGQAIGIREDVRFELATVGKEQVLQPCLDLERLKKYGIRVSAFPALTNAAFLPEQCVPFTLIIPMSEATFDFNRQKLELSIPQAALNSQVQGYVDPSLWDEGIPALLFEYSASGNRRFKQENGSDNNARSDFFNLRSGANLGPWRLRNYSTWQNSSDGEPHWQSINNFLQRSLVPLKSQLTLGDTSSSAEIFDSVAFRGMQLATDDNMYPDSQRGFAPVVRGIAQSNAQVTVKQNNFVIYQTYVAPGAFVISDLYPTAAGGDLDVTITESDGTERHFVQPFSALPVLQREGRVKYEVVGGVYRNNSASDEPAFLQGTVIWGLPDGYTLYGGGQSAAHYTALAAGIGKNLGTFGAVSTDITLSNTERNELKNANGQSIRLLYGKSFIESGTDFRLLGYRYSTSGFYTFQEATDYINNDVNLYSYRKRHQLEGTVTQRLADYGSVWLTARRQDYWGSKGRQDMLQFGYNGRISAVSYGLSYAYSRTPVQDKSDNILSFNFSVPLDSLVKNAWATYEISSNRGQTTQQFGVGGTLLDEQNLMYNVQQSYAANRDNDYGGNASLAYRGTYATSNIGYNYSQNYQQVNYGLRGGLLVHEDGLTLSQSLGDTSVLVKAVGAANTRIVNNSGVTTDWRGYAVVPSVTPYRSTRIGLDSRTLEDNVELLETGVNVVPTRGAVVRANYATRVGYRVMMVLTHKGRAIPFGAVVVLRDDNSKEPLSTIVGEQGETYLTGLPQKGILDVQWGNAVGQSCSVNYSLSAANIAQDKLIQLAQPQYCQ